MKQLLCVVAFLTFAASGAPAQYGDWPTYDDNPADYPSITTYPNPYMLGDVSSYMSGGTPVTNATQWAQRHTELLNIISYYHYGHAPPAPTVSVVGSPTDTVMGSMTQRVVNLQFTATGGGGNGATNSFFVNMYLPNNNTPRPFVNGVPNNGPYPIILSGEASWCTLTSYNIGCAPTSEAGLQALVNRGYIVAEFGRNNFSLDYSGDGGTAVFNSSIYMLYPYDSHGVTGYDWGNLLAWAWGYSRVIDYFETLSYVDKNRIAVIGMSRGAEASCVAGMYDTRIALTVAIQSCPTFERYTGGGVDTADFGSITGTGGAPGWYSAFISRFAGCYTTCLNQLPFDSPSELATIAPRGLLMEYDIRETDEFPWSGSNAYLAAKKIWTALGAPQNIGFFMGDHCHCMGDGEWNASLDFADKIWFNYIVHTPAANAINAVPAGGASDYNSMYYSGLPTTNNWPTPNLTTGGGGGLTPGAGSLKLLGVGK